MALSGRFVSIKTILDRVVNMYDLNEIDSSDLINHIADGLELLGAHSTYTEKVEQVAISEYRGELPKDLFYIKQVRQLDGAHTRAMRYATSSFHTGYYCEEKRSNKTSYPLAVIPEIPTVNPTDTPEYEQEVFIATQGQTTFILQGSPLAAWVWVEGVAQEPQYWQVVGNQITLAQPMIAGYEVSIYYATTATGTDATKLAQTNPTLGYAPLGGIGGATPTYIINKNHIQTSFNTGCVEIAYKAVILDKDGYPMVPIDARVQIGLQDYVIERIMYKQFLKGRIAMDQWKVAQQSRHFSMASARNHAMMPSMDEMESIKNIWVRLLVDRNSHANYFHNIGDREYIKPHP